MAMADVFISFATVDTPRIQLIWDSLRARGISVYWSNDLQKGDPNYQSTLEKEFREAVLVVVCWTAASIKSGPVKQECTQAHFDKKLYQVLLDEFPPIQLPMGAWYLEQKTALIGWNGDTSHPEWIKLNAAIDARLGRPSDPMLIGGDKAVASQPSMCAPGSGRDKFFVDIEAGPQMVVVPQGVFLMGSRHNEGDPDEKPQHTVRLGQPFAVSRHAITFAQWDLAVAGGVDHMCDDAGWGRGDRPAINVSWNDAQAYTAWLSRKTGHTYRLLTEAEWEYCCRAGTTTKYAFGEIISREQAQFSADRPVKVGTFHANAWGLYDMHGNVWEWVEDNKHSSYEGAPIDGSAWAGGDTSLRVLRGGSWQETDYYSRSAERIFAEPGQDARRNRFGFRVARAI